MKESTKFLQNILKLNDILVIACSGGPDSLFLLHQLINLKEEKNIEIICAHVNHNIRKQSEDEYSYVKSFCKEHNIIFEYLKIEEYHKDNFHNDAREIRYNFFENIVKKYKASYLLTAHHGDDLIETILMRLSRGSTLNGYGGFKQITKKDSYTILRPLIYLTKREITDYMDNNNLKYFIDSSNNSDKYTRNRYRKNLLPFLKNENPNVHKKYLEFSKNMYECLDYLNKEVIKKTDLIFKNNEIILGFLLQEDEFLIKLIIEEILHRLYKDNLNKITTVHKQMLYNLIYENTNKEISLPLNIVLEKEYDLIRVKKDYEQNAKYKYIFKDKVILPTGIIKNIENSNKTDNYHIYLNSQELKLPLIIRTKKEHDKMEVKNLNGHKKVKKIFIDEHIFKEERESMPILTDSADKILWIPGVKKSKFDKANSKNYDIILRYIKKEGDNYDDE